MDPNIAFENDNFCDRMLNLDFDLFNYTRGMES